MGESLMPIPVSWIEQVFSRLLAMYGNRFTSMWEGLDPQQIKQVWADGLAGFGKEDILRGLDACKTGRDWPPTLPEFRKLCRPVPAYEPAFYEAVRQMSLRPSGMDEWSHPAVYWAAVHVGTDLRTLSYSQIKGRWQAAMDGAMEGLRTGKLDSRVPRHAEALPLPGKTTPGLNVSRQHIARMREMLGMPVEGTQQ